MNNLLIKFVTGLHSIGLVVGFFILLCMLFVLAMLVVTIAAVEGAKSLRGWLLMREIRRAQKLYPGRPSGPWPYARPHDRG